MLNNVILIGRVTKDIELQTVGEGIAFARFILAVNRKYNKDEADFINIKAWRKTAELCAKFLGKGSLVAIEGRIETGSYENSEGRMIYTTDVVAEDVRFLDSKPKDSKSKKEMTVNPFTGDKIVRNDPFAGTGKQDEVSEFPWE